MAFTELNLFSGVGAMSVGLRAAIPGLRTLGYVEWDAYAAAALLARMEGEALDPAPVFCGDIADFDARLYRGRVDLVTASPPCQPYSVAGARRGNEDERSHGTGRGPIVGMLNVIEAVQPTFCFFENVPPWVTGGYFRSVWRRLSDLGYQCTEPLLLRASDVGAPHKRERVFILAYREGGGTEGGHSVPRREKGTGRAGESNEVLADAGTPGLPQPEQGELSGTLEHNEGRAVTEFRGALFPPGPADTEAWARVFEFDPTLEPALCRVADGLAYRVDRLRCTGNGVVPLQAAVAFAVLFLDGGTE